MVYHLDSKSIPKIVGFEKNINTVSVFRDFLFKNESVNVFTIRDSLFNMTAIFLAELKNDIIKKLCYFETPMIDSNSNKIRLVAFQTQEISKEKNYKFFNECVEYIFSNCLESKISLSTDVINENLFRFYGFDLEVLYPENSFYDNKIYELAIYKMISK